ncbi:MAG TPA: PorP/SprF family type IX secretion system membrane protein [Bacteroidia bacterium]|nr:PorP/SprF family type IX secretion system membrane protein [Bacteroidia bacterium]
MKPMNKNILTCIILSVYINGVAQDIHWSQPWNALIYQNPAFAGIDSRYSIGVNYRDQWNAVNKSYKTFMVAGDYRFQKGLPENVAIGLGEIISSDNSADGSYKTNSGGLVLSCLVKANPFVNIGAGIGYSIVQNSLADNFTWGAQFDGNSYNSSLATGENNNKFFHQYGDLNAGVSYIYNRNVGTVNGNDNMKWIIGYSVNHLTQPNIAITGNKDKIAVKHLATITGLLPIKDNFSWRPVILFGRQGKMNEITFGTLARYTLGEVSQITGIKKGMQFSIGALYRVNDAFIPTAEFQKANYILALSYDVNASKFTSATKFRGGFEIALRIVAPGTYLYIDKEAPPRNKKSKKEGTPMF